MSVDRHEDRGYASHEISTSCGHRGPEQWVRASRAISPTPVSTSCCSTSLPARRTGMRPRNARLNACAHRTPRRSCTRIRAARITTGNVEDHLDRASDCDWIVEAVVERIDVKRDLYDALDRVRPAGLHRLVQHIDPATRPADRTHVAHDAERFLYHPFLQSGALHAACSRMVRGPDTRPEVIEELARFW